jgi:hypothetical protein
MIGTVLLKPTAKSFRTFYLILCPPTREIIYQKPALVVRLEGEELD